MVEEIESIEYIVVESEQEALILENSLIKQLKPKYNILLRDDKSYPYIYVDLSHPFPRPQLTRKALSSKEVKYFGPFPTGAKEILNSLYELYPLVQQSSCLKGKKACLFYQMGRCLAPCEGKITSTEYKKMLKEALALLYDKEKLVKKLEQRMEEYSKKLQFEKAQEMLDRIKKIQGLEIKTSLDLLSQKDVDVIAIANEGDKVGVVKLFVREGRVVSSDFNSFLTSNFNLEEAYKQLLFSTYLNSFSKGKEVLVLTPLEKGLEKALGIKIKVPKKGKKQKLLELALLNAKELLKKSSQDTIIEAVKELLELEETPYRIEVFDNSHFYGKECVGAMVVFEGDRFKKEEYRRFNLASVDEYSQMRELLIRRVEQFNKNPPPNLWVIDGGEVLRKLALEILDSVGVKIEVVALAKEKRDFKAYRAKGGARDIIYGKKVIKLSPTDKRLLFLQKLRDEAHRFAISSSRKRFNKRALGLSKELGEAKVKRLLDYFGSFEKIEKASLIELEKVIGQRGAKKLQQFYKG